jgi:hypothetical protein
MKPALPEAQQLASELSNIVEATYDDEDSTAS